MEELAKMFSLWHHLCLRDSDRKVELAITAPSPAISILRYESDRNIELDNILLVVAQTGVYLYASFNIIGSHFSGDTYQLITGVMSIVQVLQSSACLMSIARVSSRTGVLCLSYR